MKKIIFLLWVAGWSVGVFAKPLRVVSYNVRFGFNHGRSVEAAVDWLAAQDCDVVALQELKDLDRRALERMAERWGHRYALVQLRRKGLPIGLTSRRPIRRIGEIVSPLKPGFRGALHCESGGIHYLVVHFDSQNCLYRYAEAEPVAAKARSLMEAGEKVVVLGDFNAHAAMDRTKMERKVELLEGWRRKERKGPRYRSFDAQGELDYSVMQLFFDAGLVDASDPPQPTFPTRMFFQRASTSVYEGRSHRIDYILIDGIRLKGRVQYPRDRVLHRISDHFPVVFEQVEKKEAAR